MKVHFIYEYCDGRCHWCDKAVKIYSRKGNFHDRATVDHVYPNGDIRRQDKNARPHATSISAVVACYTCNHERGSMQYTDFLLIKRPEWRVV